MTGQIIDHAVATIAIVTIFIVALGAFNSVVISGLQYVQLREVNLVAADLIDNLLLTPGSPSNWGQLNSQPVAFGLQNPGFNSYSLSPFDPLRMMSPNGTILVNNVNYSMFILPNGETMLQPTLSLVNYTTVQRIAGLQGLYGFRLTLAPTLNVTITPTSQNPLTLNLTVTGPGGPAYSASIGFTLFYIPSNQNQNKPPTIYSLFSKVTTDALGRASVSFPFDATSTAYNGIASVSAGGILSTQTIGNTNFSQVKVWPVLQNITTGAGVMIHECTYQIVPPCGKYFYNASLYLVNGDGSLSSVQLTGGAGSVTPGQNGQFTFPLGQPGIVVIGFDGNGVSKGAGFFILPWGYQTAGLTLKFGGNPTQQQAVASVRRAALMGTMHYQVILTLWQGS